MLVKHKYSTSLKVTLTLVTCFFISVNMNAQERTKRSLYKDGSNEIKQSNSSDLSGENWKSVVFNSKNAYLIAKSDWIHGKAEAETTLKDAQAQKMPELIQAYKTEQNNGQFNDVFRTNQFFIEKEFIPFVEDGGKTIFNSVLVNIEELKSQAPYYGSQNEFNKVMLNHWLTLKFIYGYFLDAFKSNVGFKEVNQNIDKEINSLNTYFEKQESQYVKTATHKKYKNQIVIAHQPITYGSENSGSFLDNVSIDGQNSGLYFMLYNTVLNGSLMKNSVGVKKEFLFAQLQLNNDIGEPIFTGCQVFYDEAYDLTDAEENQAFLSLPVFPSLENYKRDKWLDPTYYRFAQCLANLNINETYKARLFFKFPYSEQLFEKSFSLSVTQSGKENLKKLMAKIEAENLAEVKMKKPGRLHTPDHILLIQNEAKAKGFELKKVIVFANNFNVYKDTKYPYDIKNKAAKAQIAYQKNGVCYIRTIYLYQDYLGGGNYSNTKVNFDWGADEQRILCEKI